MADTLRVTLELGPKGKRVVAVAPDWPAGAWREDRGGGNCAFTSLPASLRAGSEIGGDGEGVHEQCRC